MAPPVVDGKIARNKFGNVYMYKRSMLPALCTHLRLNGIYAIARRLEIEAVPAVTGWEFSGGRNHPLYVCLFIVSLQHVCFAASTDASC